MSKTNGPLVAGLILGLLLGASAWAVTGREAPDYTRPWFLGNERVQVCKVPYKTKDSCTQVWATSNGEKIVSFTDQAGYVVVDQLGLCYEARTTFNSGDRRACLVADSVATYQLFPITNE